jgi:hypothetical protein
MTIEETHEWAKKQLGVWENLDEKIPQEALHNFGALNFLRFENPAFRGEVALAGSDLLFHFFPTESPPNQVGVLDGQRFWRFSDKFSDQLAEAFLEVFKFQEKLFWDFVVEMNSWVVRVQGYAQNPFHMELIEGVLCRLKEKTEK